MPPHPRPTRTARTLLAVAATALLVATAAPLSTAMAQDGPAVRGAAVHAGACGSDGEVVAALSGVTSQLLIDDRPSASSLPVGSGAALPLAASVTTVPTALADLVATDHSIQVRDGEGADAALSACGAIGGRTLDADLLPVALAAVGDAGVSGIALLEPADDGSTTISVFLTSEAKQGTADGPGPLESGLTTARPAGLLHFAGLAITVESATWDPLEGAITIDAVYDNPGSGAVQTASLQLDGQPSLDLDGQLIPLEFVEQLTIPARASARAQLRAAGLDAGTSLAAATLVFGRPDQHQATIALVDDAVGVSQAPTAVRIPRKQRRVDLRGTANLRLHDAALVTAGCDGRLDSLTYTPLRSDLMGLVVTVTVAGRDRLGALIHAFVRSPDGTSSVADPGVTSVTRGQTLRRLSYCFEVPAPGAGVYRLRFEGGDRSGQSRLVAPDPQDG